MIEPTMPACVGSRAPHVWLNADGEWLSTLDLFGHGMMQLSGVKGDAWRRAARVVSERLGVPLGAATIDGVELRDESGEWLSAYGIDEDGAVLVRPDGHIAWRSVGAVVDSTATLESVVAHVLGFAAQDRRALVASSVADEGRRCA